MTCPRDAMERAFTLAEIARRQESIAQQAPSYAERIRAWGAYQTASAKLVAAIADLGDTPAKGDMLKALAACNEVSA